MKLMTKCAKAMKICIICEGEEDYDYIKKLLECRVWSPYYIIKPFNAKGINKIAPIYQNKFQNDSYDLVIIFCDTEEDPYFDFNSLIKKIDKFHGKKIAKDIIYFANPCTMQIILSHFSKVKLTTKSKTRNTPLIKQLTGVDEYRATEPQRNAIMKQIDAKNYNIMKSNIEILSIDYKTISSTNFLQLINKLESDNTNWVSSLSKKIIGKA